MSYFNRFLQKLFAFIYLLTKFSFIRFLRLHNRNSKNILWIKTHPIFSIKMYLLNNDFLSDFLLIESFIFNNKEFRIVYSSEIGKFINCNIFYSVSPNCNPYNLSNYSASLFFVVKELENQGNRVFPNSSTLSFWENKSHMHNMFVEKNIPHPKTKIVSRLDDPNNLIDHEFQFPVLVKEVHSAGSKGITKVDSLSELKFALNIVFNKGHNHVLVQKLINMRKDLRVIVFDKKVISYYWRINSSSSWKPTATSFGSNTEFSNYPTQWNETFINYLDKLGLISGAFDIAWENDDLDTIPLVLEVSPTFQMNPVIPDTYFGMTYKNYKSKLFISEPYYKKFIDCTFDYKKNLINFYFRDFLYEQ